MAQIAMSADPDFVAALRTNITGIYYRQVERFTAAQITEEFRKLVRDPVLRTDVEVMPNALFLVRKKDVRGLRDDVLRFVEGDGGLPPVIEASALKTLFALEGSRDVVDERLSQRLARALESPRAAKTSPYLDAAERIGGPKTLAVLRRGQAETAARQREAEASTPDDHVRIGELDQVRSALETKVDVLSRKLAVLGRPEGDRAAELVALYLRRAVPLDYWAYRELVAAPSPAAVAAVRRTIAGNVEQLLPAGGLSAEERGRRRLDLQLRGILLVSAMKADLTADEQALVTEQAAMIRARSEFFQPNYDWEDVLDRH
jgi:hypothetical protein